MVQVDEKPSEEYSDIGGLDKQIQEVRSHLFPKSEYPKPEHSKPEYPKHEYLKHEYSKHEYLEHE